MELAIGLLFGIAMGGIGMWIVQGAQAAQAEEEGYARGHWDGIRDTVALHRGERPDRWENAGQPLPLEWDMEYGRGDDE